MLDQRFAEVHRSIAERFAEVIAQHQTTLDRDTQTTLDELITRLVDLEQRTDLLCKTAAANEQQQQALEQQFANLQVRDPSQSASGSEFHLVTDATVFPINTGTTTSSSSSNPDDSNSGGPSSAA